jgi:hypothetical protein
MGLGKERISMLKQYSTFRQLKIDDDRIQV